MGAITSIAAASIKTRQFDALRAFYGALLGPEIAFLDTPDCAQESRRMVWFAIGATSRLVVYEQEGPATGCAMHLACDDPDAFEARLRAAGIQAVVPVHDTQSAARMFLIEDPDGNEIAIGTLETLP